VRGDELGLTAEWSHGWLAHFRVVRLRRTAAGEDSTGRIGNDNRID
jgi:hypothetical protein